MWVRIRGQPKRTHASLKIDISDIINHNDGWLMLFGGNPRRAGKHVSAAISPRSNIDSDAGASDEVGKSGGEFTFTINPDLEEDRLELRPDRGERHAARYRDLLALVSDCDLQGNFGLRTGEAIGHLQQARRDAWPVLPRMASL